MKTSRYFTVIVSFCVLVLQFSCRTPAQQAALSDQQQPARASRLLPINPETSSKIIYEMQLRSANACDPSVGAPWQREACQRKPAPLVQYRARGMSCPDIDRLKRIKLGTIEDALAETTDYKAGITLRYVKDKVGANMVWVMPPFPNNDIESIPHECDNLGSPYAVRDYLHIAGSLGLSCINRGRDEYSSEPCWANDAFDKFIQKAHSLGLKVMLDVAFNHFGHGYLMYDYAEFKPMRERFANGESAESLWDFAGTYEENLLRPRLLDSTTDLDALIRREAVHRDDLQLLKQKCPDLNGHRLLIAYNSWRNALDHERAQFSCSKDEAEHRVPGFYMGADRQKPSTGPGNFFTNNWRDVKFLYHRHNHPSHQHEYLRNREYLFRIMNYWVSRGVDGFRLDHATDGDSGLSPETWHYIISKTNYYAQRRGQKTPIYHAEEFGDQWGMDRVVDMMTEGYVFAMNARGGGNKNTGHVENVLRNMDRFPNKSLSLAALETHDEHRLVDHTGFNHWTGAGFWGVGATTRSVPMLLMGQEFGEQWGLAFKRSDFIRARFEGSETYFADGDLLRNYYFTMNRARLATENRALLSPNYAFLRSKVTNQPDDRLFAQVKWSDDLNVVFAFHNLWEAHVEQLFFIPPSVAEAAGIRDEQSYRLVDALSGNVTHSCRMGRDLKWELPIKMSADTRAWWLRLETCN